MHQFILRNVMLFSPARDGRCPLRNRRLPRRSLRRHPHVGRRLAKCGGRGHRGLLRHRLRHGCRHHGRRGRNEASLAVRTLVNPVHAFPLEPRRSGPGSAGACCASAVPPKGGRRATGCEGGLVEVLDHVGARVLDGDGVQDPATLGPRVLLSSCGAARSENVAPSLALSRSLLVSLSLSSLSLSPIGAGGGRGWRAREGRIGHVLTNQKARKKEVATLQL